MELSANIVTPSTARIASRSSPIDRVHLARYTLGSLPLEIEVLGLFAEQAPITLAELANATTDKAWRDAAHTLKGSAKAVGAWRIAECAQHAETIQFGGDILARNRAIESLDEAVAQARRYIDSLSAT